MNAESFLIKRISISQKYGINFNYHTLHTREMKFLGTKDLRKYLVHNSIQMS